LWAFFNSKHLTCKFSSKKKKKWNNSKINNKINKFFSININYFCAFVLVVLLRQPAKSQPVPCQRRPQTSRGECLLLQNRLGVPHKTTPNTNKMLLQKELISKASSKRFLKSIFVYYLNIAHTNSDMNIITACCSTT
jgi:hypothetical protein